MNREFVIVSIFDSEWKKLGLTDDDLKELEYRILENPTIGSVISGTKSLRKMRISLPGRGRSGGARVLYVDFVFAKKTYLINVYAKNKKENLTKEETNQVNKLINALESELLKKEK